MLLLFFWEVWHRIPSHYSALPMRIGHLSFDEHSAAVTTAPIRSAWERKAETLVGRGCLDAHLFESWCQGLPGPPKGQQLSMWYSFLLSLLEGQDCTLYFSSYTVLSTHSTLSIIGLVFPKYASCCCTAILSLGNFFFSSYLKNSSSVFILFSFRI